MSVKEVAELTGMDQQTIRVAIQQEKVPFGIFIKKEGKKSGAYYILRHQVYEYFEKNKKEERSRTKSKNISNPLKKGKLSPKEKLDIINSNTYINTRQIRQIAECGNEKAKMIRDMANKRINELGFANYHETKIPTNILIDILGIDMEFLEKQASTSKKKLI